MKFLLIKIMYLPKTFLDCLTFNINKIKENKCRRSAINLKKFIFYYKEFLNLNNNITRQVILIINS